MFYVGLRVLCMVYLYFLRGFNVIPDTSVKISHKDDNFSHFFHVWPTFIRANEENFWLCPLNRDHLSDLPLGGVLHLLCHYISTHGWCAVSNQHSPPPPGLNWAAQKKGRKCREEAHESSQLSYLRHNLNAFISKWLKLVKKTQHRMYSVKYKLPI